MDFKDDMTHYGRIIAGLESVHGHINYNAGIDVDGTYALTVLELHAQDEGEVAGTESFLSAVKKGASDIAKWIKEIVMAIGRFLTGKKKQEPKWEDSYSRINKEEVAKAARRMYGGPLNAISEHMRDDKFEQARPYFKFMDLDKIGEEAQSLLDGIDKDTSYSQRDLFHGVQKLSKMIDDEMARVQKAIENTDLKVTGAGFGVNKLTAVAGALGKASEVLMNAWRNHTSIMAEANLETKRRQQEEEDAKDKK